MDKLNIRDAPKFAVEKVVDLAAQIKQLSDENGYFAKAQSIDDSLKAATSDLAALKELTLDDICNQVNTKMYGTSSWASLTPPRASSTKAPV